MSDLDQLKPIIWEILTIGQDRVLMLLSRQRRQKLMAAGATYEEARYQTSIEEARKIEQGYDSGLNYDDSRMALILTYEEEILTSPADLKY